MDTGHKDVEETHTPLFSNAPNFVYQVCLTHDQVDTSRTQANILTHIHPRHVQHRCHCEHAQQGWESPFLTWQANVEGDPSLEVQMM